MSPSSRGIRWSDEKKRKIAGKPLQYYRDLEMWVRGHSRSLKLIPFESLGVVSYSTSSNCSAILYFFAIYSELLVEDRKISIPHLYLALSQGWPFRNFTKMFDIRKTGIIGLPCGQEIMTMCWAISTKYGNATNRRTDGQTGGHNCYVNMLKRDKNC